ncbi:MAG: hypothetical protein L0G70_04760, partial [Rubrobacter sp.]|nr:hypothetical protein [Rubrobacter sp.]
MARPSSLRGSSEDRSRRRMATILIIVGVVLLVAWIAAISALAGGSGGSRQGGAEGSANDSSGQEQAASANASPETTTEDNGESEQGEQSSTDQGAQTEETVAGEAGTGDVFGPLEEEGQTQGGSTGSDAEGRDGPADTEITRARAASERYITAAYGYSGESDDECIEGIEQAASEEIYDSPGGSMLEGYSNAATDCGMKSTVILEEFEVIGQGSEGLDATVTFRVEDADGQVHKFSQDQRLTISGETYEVSRVSMEELISETSPTESCPGANSEKDGSGAGEAEIKPSDTSVADEDRAKAAADRYITSVFGYTGDSAKEYREGISRTADTQKLYASPAGERIQEYARAAEQDGITAAAVMESFEITAGSGEATEGSTIEGTAYFRVGKEYDRYGELKGEST